MASLDFVPPAAQRKRHSLGKLVAARQIKPAFLHVGKLCSQRRVCGCSGSAPVIRSVSAAFLDLVVKVAEHGTQLPALQSLFERGDLFQCYDLAQAYGTCVQ
jgi:hypothetical protein